MDGENLWLRAVRRGLRAARRNLVPGIAIWALAAAVLLAWHQWPAARAAMQVLADFKQCWNYPYAIVSTTIAGGLAPALILRLLTGRREYIGSQLPWLLLFWAIKGAEVNALYDFQALAFGEGHGAATLATKVAMDQLLYVPIWAIPSTVIAYAWIEGGMTAVREQWRPGWYARQVLPVLLANMALWIPAVTIVYSLATPLQLPLQNCILCFWSLMVALIAFTREQEQEQTAAVA